MRLSEVERVDVDLRAAYTQRERARDELIQAFIDLLAAESRLDVLLDRRNQALQ